MNKKISFASDIKNICIAEQLIDDIKQKYSLDMNSYDNILIAVLEAVTNCIIHGNKHNPDKKVNLQFEVTDNAFQFIVADEGPGFDYEYVPDPTKAINIEKSHGRGIFLMTELSNDIAFKNNGRSVKLIFTR